MDDDLNISGAIAAIFDMMHEIKAVKLLEGVRGKRPVDFGKLADMLLRVSKLMLSEPSLRELDFNPVMANDKEVVVVDVRAIL